jgi:hypothetical protein
MVSVVIDCRLGNQLFQYAFIKALAIKISTPFYVNENLEKFIAADYFDFDGYHPFNNKVKRIYFKLRHGSLFKSLQSVPIDSFNFSAPDALSDNKTYQGYFQSELYFENVGSDINHYIKVKESHKKRFHEKYNATFSTKKVIAIHIRRGDYLNLNNWWKANLGSSDLTLPLSYYRDCLQQIKDYKNYKIIFVSDDLEFTRANFAEFEDAEFADNDAITDFQVMMNADICIIANSSFAWWAAYLNTKKDKQIFCPKYWLGFKIKSEYPEYIIHPNWIQVEVTINDN